jgi:Skp family chaperone for outer membrane proteins
VKSLISYAVKTVAIAVVAVTVFASNTQAQESQSGVVAVLDVAEVFKSNAEFEAQMNSIKQDAEGLKQTIQQRQEAIKQEAQQVSQMEALSPARQEAETAVEQKQALLRTEARQAEAALLNREAQVYYTTYTEMQDFVRRVAEVNNISLVIRFDSAPIDQTNRQEVIKGVNRTVVHYGNQINLTKMVIDGMAARSASAGAPNTK